MSKVEKPDKPEKPVKPERPEKPMRPAVPLAPSEPERPVRPDKSDSARKAKKRDSALKFVFSALIVAAVLVVALVVAWIVTSEMILFLAAVAVLVLTLLSVAPYFVRRMMVYGKMSRASIKLSHGKYVVEQVAYSKHRLGGIMSRHVIVQLKKGSKVFDKRFILDDTFFNARGRREWLHFCNGIGVDHESIEKFIVSQKDGKLLDLYLKGLCGKEYEV